MRRLIVASLLFRYKWLVVLRTVSFCLGGAILLAVSVAPARAASGSSPRFTGYEQVAEPPPGVAYRPQFVSSRPDLRDDLPGLDVPPLQQLGDLWSRELLSQSVPLSRANTLGSRHLRQQDYGWLKRPDGQVVPFNREILLVKFRALPSVSAIRVPPGTEVEAARRVSARGDVEFCELDIFEQPAFVPDDPLLSNQWHHEVIGSFQAWDFGALGPYPVTVAIVDEPFQMDHPDLAMNAVPGWDVDTEQPITGSGGIAHSTLCAGLAAAVLNNHLGIAGASNGRLLPVNINGSVSDMYKAAVWAADHGVRVVNISWTGGDSDTLNTAGAYLKARAAGLLVMAGGNRGVSDYLTNQPDILCISMTDAADNMQSLPGVQVDFAAPGWSIYSTTINGGYSFASGTSYSAPLFSGVVAALFSMNPLLQPDAVLDILKRTAVDKGPPGWDQWFGWGRIDFAAAAAEARRLLPRLELTGFAGSRPLFTTQYQTGNEYSLWRAAAPSLANWTLVTDASVSTNGNTLVLQDPDPPLSQAFYRLSVSRP